MLSLPRRRSAAILAGTTFCDSCAEVCTAACRAERHYDRARTRALSHAAQLR